MPSCVSYYINIYVYKIKHTDVLSARSLEILIRGKKRGDAKINEIVPLKHTYLFVVFFVVFLWFFKFLVKQYCFNTKKYVFLNDSKKGVYFLY